MTPDKESERNAAACGFYHRNSSCIDATERKRAEEALRHSKERLRLITDNAPALISDVDLQQRYRFVNRRYEEWFGLSQKEIVGK